jgi:phenylalanyl-tRNA synthetase beta subunit
MVMVRNIINALYTILRCSLQPKIPRWHHANRKRKKKKPNIF